MRRTPGPRSPNRARETRIDKSMSPTMTSEGADDAIDSLSVTSRQSMRRRRRDLPVDGGWAWVVLGACFLNMLLAVGYLKVFGMVYVQLLDIFKLSHSATIVVMAVHGAVFSIGGLVTQTVILSVLSIRTTVILGGFIHSFGIIATVFVENLGLVILLQSAVTGFACSMIMNPSVTAVCQYFRRRRALATGLVWVGANVGGILVPPLMDCLLQEYGFKGSLLLYGALALNVVVFGALIRPLPEDDAGDDDDAIDQSDDFLKRDDDSEGKDVHVNFPDDRDCLYPGEEAISFLTSRREDECDARGRIVKTHTLFEKENATYSDEMNPNDCVCLKRSWSSECDGSLTEAREGSNVSASDQQVKNELCCESEEDRESFPAHVMKTFEEDVSTSSLHIQAEQSDISNWRVKADTVSTADTHPDSVGRRERTPRVDCEDCQKHSNASLFRKFPFMAEPSEEDAASTMDQEEGHVRGHTAGKIGTTTGPSKDRDGQAMLSAERKRTRRDDTGERLVNTRGSRRPWWRTLPSLRKIFDVSLFRDLRMVILLVFTVFAVVPCALMNTFLPVLAKSKGLGTDVGALALTVASAAGLSKLGWGWLTDRFRGLGVLLFSLALVFTGLLANLSGLFQDTASFLVYSACYGCAGDLYFALQPLLSVQLLGRVHFAKVYGYVQMVEGMGVVAAFFFTGNHGNSTHLAACLTGWLRDVTGNFDTVHHFLGACALVAAAILLIATGCNMTKARHEDE